jgi:hypothetical protein
MEKKKNGHEDKIQKSKYIPLNKKRYFLEFMGTKSQFDEIKHYFDNLPFELIVFGLRFSYNRNRATIGGYLNPGRKSIVKKETYLMTKKQAKIRIKNWKVMIKRYRKKGYSYPTISRIKKQITRISNN